MRSRQRTQNRRGSAALCRHGQGRTRSQEGRRHPRPIVVTGVKGIPAYIETANRDAGVLTEGDALAVFPPVAGRLCLSHDEFTGRASD